MDTGNKIFIFEFISGGGFNKENIPSSLFCEGFAMLNAITADFSQLQFEVHTLLDERIAFFSKYLHIDDFLPVKKKDKYFVKFKQALSKCDSCLIIAPEFSNILYDLTRLAEKENKTILSVTSEGIELAGSKMNTYDLFRAEDIPTPKTYALFSEAQNVKERFLSISNKLGFPLIIKPNDGVSAESVYLIENKKEVDDFFEQSKEYLDQKREYLVQEYRPGRNLSASVILPLLTLDKKKASRKSILLSINNQNLKFEDISVDSEYIGGATPATGLKAISKNFLDHLNHLDLSSFQSYIGIDFILNECNEISFIEINPRLTTSYIGIRNALHENPIHILLNPGEYGEKFFFSRQKWKHSQFSRVELVYKGDKDLMYIYEDLIPEILTEIPEFVTPPISFGKPDKNRNMRFSCFLATSCENKRESRVRIAQIYDLLQKWRFYHL
ncbi:MAG: ATP-grasp domain-containing protein [Promethearchaeia archaeon]